MTQESLPFHDDTSRRIPALYIEAGKYGLPKARAALAKREKMRPDTIVSRPGRRPVDACETIHAVLDRSRSDPDLALIETIVASDMNDHAKMRTIERILR